MDTHEKDRKHCPVGGCDLSKALNIKIMESNQGFKDEITTLRIEVVQELKELREALLNAALGTDRIPVDVVLRFITPVIKALCWVLAVLVVWLTGVKALLPHLGL